jgi:outer membrane protein
MIQITSNRSRWIVLTFLSGCVWAVAPEASPPSVQPVTLEECYRKAIQTSETLSISEQEIVQMEALYRQGVAGVLPNLSWQMTQFYQDTSGNSVSASSSSVQSTLQRSHTPQSYFQLQQPLFHGLRELNAIKGYKASTEVARQQKNQFLLDLLSDVSDVFYTAHGLQQEIEVLISQRQLTEDRIKELERRVRLGKSRDSEVLSARVDLASLDAQTEDTRQQHATSRQVLMFLTQVTPDIPLKDDRPFPQGMALEEALARSSQRPDLKAAEYEREVQRHQLNYSRGGYLPGVDFTGKYYTERVGFQSGIKWDALFSIDVPIFTGFATQAEVQGARSKLLVADLQAHRLRRLVNQQVAVALQNLQYGLRRSASYSSAVELAEKNYKIQEEEYRLGLIKNLDVLQTLTQLQDLRTQLLRAQAATQRNAIQLRVATGEGL